MMDAKMKKPFLFSLLSHAALFGIFSFSFGYKLISLDSSRVSFLGSLLNNTQLAATSQIKEDTPLAYSEVLPGKLPSLQKEVDVYHGFSGSKPAIEGLSIQEKAPFSIPRAPLKFAKARVDTSIMFYPEIPYHFLLYFKDRQVANIEIMFNLSSAEGVNYINIKRKISSGSLEADLLSMRYLSHYLFVQQNRFALNRWQVVKIELRAKDDSH